MTLAEKILARASGRDRVVPGEFVVGRIDLAMVHDIFAVPVFEALREVGREGVWDPERVAVVIDHLVPAPTEAAALAHRRIRERVAGLGIRRFFDAGSGICHQVLAEGGHVRPGMLVVGTDSHTTTAGALAAAGTGIGTSEMVYVLATGRLWFRVPEALRVDLRGSLPALVSWKDAVLHLAGRLGADGAQYRSLEFAGPAAADVEVGGRLTMCNMAVELGAKFGMFPADRTTVAYLAERGVVAEPLAPDPDARYLEVHEVDLSALEPQVAVPDGVDRVRPVREVAGLPIQQAFVGSCTNGRLGDLEEAALVLRGRRVAPGVRLLVAPASRAVYEAAARGGVLAALVEAGATVLPPGCGPCFGGHGGLLAPGERCIGSHNRNFRGRMGSPEAEIYLASPATVAASAVAGGIADPRDVVAPAGVGP